MRIARRRAGVGAVATAVLSAAGLAPPGVAAQGVAPEEVIVTARKRAENLQEVPLSISVLGTEALRLRNIQTVYDVATFTPNFSFNRNTVGRRLDAPAIRGQFTPLLNFGAEGNVAFYVDGVYVSGTAASLSTDNVARVEILKGPQAAQFGRAAFAGAVNYITFQPGEDFDGQVNVKAGEDSDYKANAWASGPLVDGKVGFVVSAGWESFGGEWQNALAPCGFGVPDGTDGCTAIDPRYLASWQLGQPPSTVKNDFTPLGGESSWNLTGKLVFTPTDNLELSLKVDYTETDDDHFASLLQPARNCYVPGDPSDPKAAITDPNSPGWFCGELKPDGLRAQMNIADLREGADSRYTQDLEGTSLYAGPAAPAPFIGTRTTTERYLGQASWSVGGWTLAGVAAANRQELESYRDLDRSPYLGPVWANVFAAGELQTWEDQSLELRATSDQDRRLRGTLGTFFYDAENLSFQREFTGFCNRVEYGRPFINDQPSWTLKTDKQNLAFFGGVGVDVTDTVSVEVEARYARDTPEAQAANGVSAKANYYSLTPRFTVTWQAREDLNLYALAALGNKPGGFFYGYFDAPVTADATRAALTPDGSGRAKAVIEEEEAWTYELGSKTQWLDGRVTANVAVYFIDWTNQAINEIDQIPWTCGDTGLATNVANNIIRNAGESQVVGAEFELTVAATENLLLTFNYGLADTRLEQFNSLVIDDLVRDDAIGNPGNNASGQQAPRVPKHTVAASATYRRPLPGGRDGMEWFLRADYVYNSKSYIDVENEAWIGPLSLVNTRIGLQGDAWTAALYIDNLTNDDTPLLGSEFPNFNGFPGQITSAFHLVPRRSRNAGINVQYRF
jgi:outer membrane receptor protein involved in Fe transport